MLTERSGVLVEGLAGLMAEATEGSVIEEDVELRANEKLFW